jgi:hypothetical protein
MHQQHAVFVQPDLAGLGAEVHAGAQVLAGVASYAAEFGHSLALLLGRLFYGLIVNPALIDVKSSRFYRRDWTSRQLMETSIGDIGDRIVYQMIKGRFLRRRRRSASADFCMSFLLRVQTAPATCWMRPSVTTAAVHDAEFIASRHDGWPAACSRTVAPDISGTKQSEVQKIREGDIQ